ncbi:putative O-sialoglycoprotein endopeptidase [Candidatus Sulfopaludibacter sp. SbA3]|nr:putative O-sialoglycoprotein endopeptidase [Candidatus Sulfopaludibacter sp. SbA3]
MSMVRILGIESSCDETAASVVEDGERVLSSIVASQMTTHGKYGGVVPELASREHLRAIVPVVREALSQSATRLDNLSAIAVTIGPGLVGSLLVGLTYAKSLSFARAIPLIAVNHIEGHIHAVILEAKRAATPVRYPALALVVSGGHTHLFEVREGFQYRLLGKTRDDAAGEAFDKVAKLLGYPYPGGPVIDRLAPHGDPSAVRFTFAKMKGNALDFSFSGLKTAVLRWVAAPCSASFRKPESSSGLPILPAARWTCWLRSSMPSSTNCSPAPPRAPRESAPKPSLSPAEWPATPACAPRPKPPACHTRSCSRLLAFPPTTPP